MRLLIKKIAETVMNEVSYSKLHGTLKAIGVPVSKDSVIDYIGYAMDAYLLFAVRNFFSAFSERESTPKYYFSDNSLLQLFLLNKPNALLENLTAITLYRQYGNGVFYLRSSGNGIDIDFYVPETGLAVQVCQQLNDISAEREIGNLVKLAHSMEDVQRLLIITPDVKQSIQREDVTIEVLPVDWFILYQK